MEYVRNGKDAVFKAGRYGTLVAGTAEYRARIPQAVDWRALRLVRSETSMSLQNSVVANAEFNLGCTGFVDWVLTEGAVHECVCPKLAEGSPYKLDKVPKYPHPSCMCTIRQILRDHDSFIADLKKWSDGKSISYIDKWATKIAS
jgi:hypothetical protein